jgi:GTP:adenosylcobinamide-phosphate guanylyltransferase
MIKKIKKKNKILWLMILIAIIISVGLIFSKTNINNENFENEYKYNNLLTIIITASFIPSHPSISLIKETIESLQYLNYPSDTRIILAHDFNNDNNYNKYLENLNNYIKPFSNIEITKCKKHGHLVGNIRNALSNVNSKYILVIQHDLPFIKDFNIHKVIEDMDENPDIKHVRFNKRENIKKGFDALNNLFGLQLKQKNYTYTRTPAWSDNNHLCLTSYYNDIILKECKDGGCMENILQGKIKDIKKHQKYGTYIFGPLGNEPVIKHTDGRNTKIDI